MRLDTSDKLADESLRRLHGDAAPDRRRARAGRARALRARRARLQGRPHRRLRRLHRRPHPAFEAKGIPVDSYGVGSSLIRGSNDFTADVVMNEGKPAGKVGREFKPNPRLEARR